jgi:hypothetical protein
MFNVNSLVRPRAQAVSQKGTSIICWRCKRQGHVRLNCPSLTENSRSGAQGNDFRLAAVRGFTRFRAPVDSLSRKISSRPKGSHSLAYVYLGRLLSSGAL